MFTHCIRVVARAALVTGLGLCACGRTAGPVGPIDGADDPVPREDDEAYTSDVDPDRVVTLGTIADLGHPGISYPVDQLVIQAADGVTRDDIVALVDTLADVTLIGQSPASGMYQLQLGTTTVEGLRVVREALRLQPLIEQVSVNAIFIPATDPGSCPTHPDVRLDNLDDHQRLPYEQTDLFDALDIVDQLKDELPMRRVTVGLIEQGYGGSGEFTQTPIRNVSERLTDGQRLELDADDAHGTALLSILAADNNGLGLNGLANTLLGTTGGAGGAFDVAFARPRGWTLAGVITAVDQVIAAGADIVVLSLYAYGDLESWTVDPAISEIAEHIFADFGDIQNALSAMLRRHPDVLFISAAPNATTRITSTNCAPCGLSRANNITVTSWSHDDATRRAAGTAFGPGVDMSAPGVDLVVLAPDGWDIASGTSLATPFVAAAAAVLQTVAANELSPPEIRTLLTESTYTERTEPGGGIQVSLVYPLVDLLWQDYGDSGWAMYVLDIDADDLVDNPEVVATTVCDEANLEIGQYGTFTLRPEHACSIGDSMLMSPDGTDWALFMGGLDTMFDVGTFTLQNRAPMPFRVDYEYVLTDDDSGDAQLGIHVDTLTTASDDRCVAEDAVEGDWAFTGLCDAGVLTFTRCQVSQRAPDGSAKYLTVDITLDCTVSGDQLTFYPGNAIVPIVAESITTTARAWLRNVRVSTPSPLGVYTEEVEAVCEGRDDSDGP